MPGAKVLPVGGAALIAAAALIGASIATRPAEKDPPEALLGASETTELLAAFRSAASCWGSPTPL